ncbi:MAG: hypothetical protein M1429_00835 [Patescibacteria group bacterium]|nr:hypothetical protein [Patescibacteria group bacterium]
MSDLTIKFSTESKVFEKVIIGILQQSGYRLVKDWKKIGPQKKGIKRSAQYQDCILKVDFWLHFPISSDTSIWLPIQLTGCPQSKENLRRRIERKQRQLDCLHESKHSVIFVALNQKRAKEALEGNIKQELKLVVEEFESAVREQLTKPDLLTISEGFRLDTHYTKTRQAAKKRDQTAS